MKIPFEIFEQIVNELDKIRTRVSGARKLGIDLIEYEEPFNKVHTLFIKGVYNDVGDWFSWFCYENDFGRGKLTATDKDKKPICRNVRELWELLEENSNKNCL